MIMSIPGIQLASIPQSTETLLLQDLAMHPHDNTYFSAGHNAMASTGLALACCHLCNSQRHRHITSSSVSSVQSQARHKLS